MLRWRCPSSLVRTGPDQSALVEEAGLHACSQRKWREFLSLKRALATENRDYQEWHRGRREYAIWMIGVRSRSVQSRFNAARAHMEEYLFKPYRRQPHVTLCVCGFMAPVKRFQDDFASEELERCLGELEEARPASFEIEIGGISSFAAAPFLEVFDSGGGLEKIRNVLSGNRPEFREGEYVPHLTLGLYAGPFETKMVAEKISSFGLDTPISHRVEDISLATYSAREVAGPLSEKYVLSLGAD